MIDWEQVRVDAAISAMQGVLESGKLGEILETAPGIVAIQSVRFANALVEELKLNASDSDLVEELKTDIKNKLKRKSPGE